MRSRLPTRREVVLWTRREVLWTVVGSLLVAVFIFLGYRYQWQWTGFPQKRLFDWIQILVIPVAVAIGTFVLNRSAQRRDDAAQLAQRKSEEQLQHQRTEDATLQAYLDYMSGMLTDPDRPLQRSHLGDTLSVAARAQTLTALRRLQDGERKGSAIQFLYEAGLINGTYPIISLQGANLQRAILQYTDLQRANLRGARLQDAKLKGTNLLGANLQAANLQAAILQEANLRSADLRNADLQGGWLLRANLLGVNLHGVRKLTQEQINEAFGDENT